MPVGDCQLDLVSLADLAMRKQPQLVRYDTTGGRPSFDLWHERWQDWYWIPEDRIDTAAKLVEWIRHLSEKTWVTKEHLRQLIHEVEKRHKGVCAYGC